MQLSDSGSLQDQLAAKLSALTGQDAAEDTTETATTGGRFARVVARVLDVEAASVTSEKTAEDLGVSSLDRIEIAVRTEEEFGIRISEDTWLSMSTVGDVIAALEESD